MQEPKRYTICFLFTPDGSRVLLQRKCKTDFKGLLNGVGGKFEADETPRQCALREIREETTVGDVRSLTWLGTLVLPADCNADTHDRPCELYYFAGTCAASAPHRPDGEPEEIAWYDVGTVLRDDQDKYAGHGDLQYFVGQAVRRLQLGPQDPR